LVWSGVCDKKEMYLKTHNPIKKGEELCISYGLDKADDQLYACHGFWRDLTIQKKIALTIFET
jgi:SET domain-containing protein